MSGVTDAVDTLTVQAFHDGIKPDKADYKDLSDGFVATEHMHNMHSVLDEVFAPNSDVEAALFKEMQSFMYDVLEDHLKTDKGKLLVRLYKATRDAQSIYRDLKKHELRLPMAKLSDEQVDATLYVPDYGQ